MIIGVPKEIKEQEQRVAITPAGVEELRKDGHEVIVESMAGFGSGYSNADYYTAGAKICTGAASVWDPVDLIVKVKEPLNPEFKFFRKDLVLFAYLHLESQECKQLTIALKKAEAVAIAYESIIGQYGDRPLLRPMSEIAGRMSIQIAAQCLEARNKGKGILMGGIPGVRRANVVIIGGGVAGRQAAHVAVGMGARVTILDIDEKTLSSLSKEFGNSIDLLFSNKHNLEGVINANTDVVIGAVLVPGSRAPKLITKEMTARMQRGSVIVDIAIDQGGCIEACDKSTTHTNPTFIDENGIIYYCVANMPGAVPQTSTIALTNATLKYVKLLAKTIVDNNGDFSPDSLFSRMCQSRLPNGIQICQDRIFNSSLIKIHDL